MTASSRPRRDARSDYNDYWSRPDRAGESRAGLDGLVARILSVCGTGSILDVGSGEGALVSALLARGADARGVDVSDVVVSRGNERRPGRFTTGSALALPFADDTFDTVVSTDCLEHLAAEDVPAALLEIRRVARRSVFLRIGTAPDRDGRWHLTVEGRAWWEKRCFAAGFRKHPAYYRLNEYEALNQDGPQVAILLEKLPQAALEQYPLEALDEERGLHMDMLRDTGERSDAHVIRYQWACQYIRPGDRVLDAACGLGYGARVIERLTQAESVTGIDGSEFAVDYASKSFASPSGNISYCVGMLPAALAALPDGSFDAIVSFETLEHVPDPEALIAEFRRLLTPSGRLLVSVPNDWSDETGEDPNPYHLHVYDWWRLKRELGGHFLLEEAYAQTASQRKVHSRGNRWERHMRSLRKEDLEAETPADCEWWLMAAMKSPLDAHPYRERVFANIAGSSHSSIDYAGAYDNPWLMHAMVNVTYRLRNPAELLRLAADVMAVSRPDSNDYAAALCVTAYRAVDLELPDAAQAVALVERIDAIEPLPRRGPMGLRWKVSLIFVKALLLQESGSLGGARQAFEECGRLDVRPFGIHLATKVTAAWFLAGKIAHSMGDLAGARENWDRGVKAGDGLLSARLDEILIESSYPNLFNYGDGVREYTLAWDNIARSANGLHLLRRGGPIDHSKLESSFQTEYSIVAEALRESRAHLAKITDDVVDVRGLVTDRTEQLEVAARDLASRTQELVETRALVVERTAALEKASAELRGRTKELVDARAMLTERTRLLEAAMHGMPHAAQELVEARELLIERTSRLESASRDLKERTDELVEIRAILADRTQQLETASQDLKARTEELVEVRDLAAQRTRSLEAANRDLASRTQELVETREALGQRTHALESLARDLRNRTRELGERTGEFEVANTGLRQRMQELESTRETLSERTGQLQASNKDLDERIRALVETRAALAERTATLERAQAELERTNASLRDAGAQLEAIRRAPFAFALKTAFRRIFK